MSGRHPINTLYPGLDAGSFILDTELLAEKASALGDAERKVLVALAALRAFDAGGGDGVERPELVYAASQAVWGFFVQRELCGLRDQKAVIRDMAIPGEVLLRLGAIPARKR
jgi:hypothetical protein